MTNAHHPKIVLSQDELDTLHHLRQQKMPKHREHATTSLGQRVADAVAATVGSWRFIIIQTVLISFWITFNIYGWMNHWDPYPFILLNLFLSFQAAYTAPFIMMSQNRQSEIDRHKADKDYHVNLRAVLEIESLHQKLDHLRDHEIVLLKDIVQLQAEKLDLLLQQNAAAGKSG
jgi:uncharacterized membrane protein